MPPMKKITTLLLFYTLGFYAQTEEALLPNFSFPDGKSLESFVDKGLVLVYGDSNCPACKQAQGHLEIRYKKWKSWGFPVVYIALDSSKKNLAENFGTPQWPIYCDEKSWDSPWVIAADIQATPTLLLLDQNLKKEYEAENVAQMDLWLLRKNFP